MSILFFEGFETCGTELGLANEAITGPRVQLRWDASARGVPFSDTDSFFLIDDVFSEGYALQMGSNGLSANNFLEWIVPDALQDTPANAPEFIIGARVHFPLVARTDVLFQIYGQFILGSDALQIRLVYVNSTDLKVQRAPVSAIVGEALGAVTPGAWHYIEFGFKCAEAGNGGWCTVYVDGVAVIEEVDVDLNYAMGVSAFSKMRFEAPIASTDSHDYLAYDDIYILNMKAAPHQTYLSPTRVRSFPPDGDILTNWDTNTGIFPNYDKVDENGADDADYVQSDKSADLDKYTLTDPDPGYLDPVYAVKLEAEAINMTGGSPSLELQIISNGSSDTEKVIVDNTVDYEVHSIVSETDPDTSTDWDPDSAGAMQVGLLMDTEL